MNKVLYWLNILIFPVILFKLLDIFTDVHIFSNLSRYSMFIGLVLLIYFSLVFLVHFSYKFKDMPSKKHLYRSPYYVVIGVILFLFIANIYLILSGGELGLGYAGFLVMNLIAIVGIIITIIFLKTLVRYVGVSKEKEQRKIQKDLIFTITSFIIIILLFYLENTALIFCNKPICRYKQFYEKPELCESGKWYIWHCSIEAAIYFKDPSFCDKSITNKNVVMFYYESLRTEEDLQLMGVKFDYASEINKQRDRCKKWVSYYQARDFVKPDRLPPWAYDYPPNE